MLLSGNNPPIPPFLGTDLKSVPMGKGDLRYFRMTKGQIYKYTITLLLVASLTILFLMGFFKGLQPGNFISLLVLLLSISYFFYNLIACGQPDYPFFDGIF